MNQYAEFPFLKSLEDGWEDVLEELNNLLYNEAENQKSYFQPWHEVQIYEGKWDVYGLYAFGEKLEGNCRRCPKTTALVESVPGLVTARFSALEPETHIRPHVGYSSDVLRCHLGLVTPKPVPDYDRRATGVLTANTCGLRVDDEFYYWEPGKAFVFDDTNLHEAWNWGDRTRFILLLDFKKKAPRSSAVQSDSRSTLANLLSFSMKAK
jgi:ornithine lipid ester-linked acyl 2-hydroxylase